MPRLAEAASRVRMINRYFINAVYPNQHEQGLGIDTIAASSLSIHAQPRRSPDAIYLTMA
jgi:hypothetical protein